MAYDQGAKRFGSLGEMPPADFTGFPLRRGVARRRRCRAISFWADVARLRDSGMAPQAIAIAQNGLGINGVAGLRRIDYANHMGAKALGCVRSMRTIFTSVG